MGILSSFGKAVAQPKVAAIKVGKKWDKAKKEYHRGYTESITKAGGRVKKRKSSAKRKKARKRRRSEAEKTLNEILRIG